MSKPGGYVCICDRNTTDTGFRVVSHSGLKRQVARSDAQMQQVKLVWFGQTKGRETIVQGECVTLAADQIVVEKNSL